MTSGKYVQVNLIDPSFEKMSASKQEAESLKIAKLAWQNLPASHSYKGVFVELEKISDGTRGKKVELAVRVASFEFSPDEL